MLSSSSGWSSSLAQTARSCACRTSVAWNWAPRATRRTSGTAVGKRQAWAYQLLPSANALEVYSAVLAEMDRLEQNFPSRHALGAGLRAGERGSRVDRGGRQDAGRSDCARRARALPVPSELAEHAHPSHHDSGVSHWHLRVHASVRLLHQHADPVRRGARDRHRGGRRHRRHREHRAAHARGWQECARRLDRRHARSVRRCRGHWHRPGGGVRAGGILPGDHGPDVSAVRDHHRVCRHSLGVHRRDADAGAVGAAPRQGQRATRAGVALSRGQFSD